ncbi:MAG: tRNA pseudouridine(55) synthase TruB [Patescibacteria group bacterium]
MNGYLLIDKPEGWTSFDVVAKVRSTLQKELRQQAGERRKLKVGHCGTLDPLATGLMVIMVGSYTKRSQELTKLDKVYEVEMMLGSNSTTADAEGELTEVSDMQPEKEEVVKTIESYIGGIMQTPPAYSAIKINGQRAYKLARAGKEVKLQPRPVTIHSISNIGYSYPRITFTVHVSSGTYIRSLVQDIGSDLSTGAYMSALRRTKVGNFDLANATQTNVVDGSKLLTLD